MQSELVIDAEGVRVVGAIVERTSTDIEVVLRHPHGDLALRHSSHIPSFGRQHASFAGEGGDVRARSLLREAFESIRHTARHLDELRLRWEVLHAGLENRCGARVHSAEELRRVRTDSRRLLRAGMITRAEHQRIVGLAAAELDEWHMAVEDALDELWRDTPVSSARSIRHRLMLLIDPTFRQEDVD